MDENGDGVDLDSLNQLEADFYKSGYDAGFQHGQAHGVFEGRALGQEKGFEIWEELGYYRGTAIFWQAVAELEQSKKKALAHIEQLLGLIDQFPAENDSLKQDAERDIEALLQSIRQKYRVMCASLTIRPRLQKAAMSM